MFWKYTLYSYANHYCNKLNQVSTETSFYYKTEINNLLRFITVIFFYIYFVITQNFMDYKVNNFYVNGLSDWNFLQHKSYLQWDLICKLWFLSFIFYSSAIRTKIIQMESARHEEKGFLKSKTYEQCLWLKGKSRICNPEIARLNLTGDGLCCR